MIGRSTKLVGAVTMLAVFVALSPPAAAERGHAMSVQVGTLTSAHSAKLAQSVFDNLGLLRVLQALEPLKPVIAALTRMNSGAPFLFYADGNHSRSSPSVPQGFDEADPEVIIS